MCGCLSCCVLSQIAYNSVSHASQPSVVHMDPDLGDGQDIETYSTSRARCPYKQEDI